MRKVPDDRMDEVMHRLREDYNAPPPTPREEMWAEIQARLGPREGRVARPEEARAAAMARYRRPLSWAVAAAAVLVVGVGIGRMTAPGVGPLPQASSQAAPNRDVLRVAALHHLVRTESLLTLIRADARAGRVEPAMGMWARSLLSETRLLMDAQGDGDPAMKRLLEDLELVLAQIAGAAHADGGDQARVRSEMTLALNGMEEREVLPRIQAVIPAGPGFAGI